MIIPWIGRIDRINILYAALKIKRGDSNVPTNVNVGEPSGVQTNIVEPSGVRVNLGECYEKGSSPESVCNQVHNQNQCNRTSGCGWEGIGSHAYCTSAHSINSNCPSLLTNNECRKYSSCSRTMDKVCVKDEARCKKEGSITAIPYDCILPDEECMYKVYP